MKKWSSKYRLISSLPDSRSNHGTALPWVPSLRMQDHWSPLMCGGSGKRFMIIWIVLSLLAGTAPKKGCLSDLSHPHLRGTPKTFPGKNHILVPSPIKGHLAPWSTLSDCDSHAVDCPDLALVMHAPALTQSQNRSSSAWRSSVEKAFLCMEVKSRRSLPQCGGPY